MTSFAIRVAVNAVAVWVATRLIEGLTVSGDSGWPRLALFLVIGLLLAVVNAVVKPVIKVLSFPLYILTLGLFGFIVNALMLELTAWLSEVTPVTFAVADFFWSAVLGAVVITVATLVLNLVLPDGKKS
ncbi:MAG: phage holin family protein [Geodermatophilaceae bacterium]|nr:phage holin family protein [Geodermatophilaceae bacterium]MDQ3454784.1 phage holin family protein [Actinomycetota bacterium]